MLKEFIIALSLSNLCFYNIILAFFYKNKFHLKDLPGVNQFLALILSELLIAALFWLAWRFAKKINNRYLILAAKFFVCLLVLIFIYELARDFKLFINLKIFRICLLILLIILLIKKKTTKVVTGFLLLMSPFICVIFFQSIQGTIIDLTKKTTPELRQPLFSKDTSTPRVLWIIYDALDYRIAFIDKPYNLKMPAFDKLLQHSISAHNAYPPANKTRYSLPALIDGKMISESYIINQNTLSIVYQGDNKPINWGSQPNVFSRAKELKLNSAFVGEFLPYSRIIGKDLSFCEWVQYYPQYSSSKSIIANMYQQIRMLLIGPARHHVQRKEAYEKVQNLTTKLVANLDYNLIMIHNPIPHYPYFYQQPWWDDRSPEGYVNALKLVDLSLAEIRQKMDEKGIWDQTNVIISADHGLNLTYDGKLEQRIPFIVKLAGQKQSLTYERAFNTVITQDLVLSILRGDVSSPKELISFLNQRAKMSAPVIGVAD